MEKEKKTVHEEVSEVKVARVLNLSFVTIVNYERWRRNLKAVLFKLFVNISYLHLCECKIRGMFGILFILKK